MLILLWAFYHFPSPFAGVTSPESSFGFLGQSNIYKCECHAFSIHACSMNTGCKKIKCYLGLARLSVSQSVLVRMLLWLYSMLLWLYCMLLRQYSGFHIQLFSSGGDKSSMGGGLTSDARRPPPQNETLILDVTVALLDVTVAKLDATVAIRDVTVAIMDVTVAIPGFLNFFLHMKS